MNGASLGDREFGAEEKKRGRKEEEKNVLCLAEGEEREEEIRGLGSRNSWVFSEGQKSL